jgi:adenylate kinase family enzyme
MPNILIFGNSGSGKSTLAKKIAKEKGLAHLDLDTLAWQPVTPPERMAIIDSSKLINTFTNGNNSWVIEGCYTDLLELLSGENEAGSGNSATEIIFLDMSVSQCITNAKNRPWEPHKYSSKQAQDDNLDMLITWIKDYDTRVDTFSKRAHEKFYNNFQGTKKHITNIQ